MKQAIPFILPAMLMAFGAAQAQTAPGQQTPQQMPQQEMQQQQELQQQEMHRQELQQQKPQQAPRSTPASAAQTTSCGGAANRAITAMNKGDFDGAMQSFDPAHKPASDKLQEAWGNLTKQYGNAKSIGGASQGQVTQGYVVVLVPLQFDKGQLGAEAACGVNGQLVMLRFGLMPNAAASKS
ncbi:DUF3887 domain-containing protein [Rhodanobacter aciditrophus]|uniref:DUF3887 domain-containing protein n=1 Tax=Rhodanobacter aciditrophus TaxID=1623218 RepID=UPI003CEAC258